MRMKQRLIALLLVFSMMVPFFAVSSRVGAVAVVDDLAIAMAAFSISSGLSFQASGISGQVCVDWLTNEALPAYLNQNGFTSKEEWWGDARVESYPLTGKVVFGKMAVQLLSTFFSWITGEYKVVSGGESVVVSTVGIPSQKLPDWTTLGEVLVSDYSWIDPSVFFGYLCFKDSRFSDSRIVDFATRYIGSGYSIINARTGVDFVQLMFFKPNQTTRFGSSDSIAFSVYSYQGFCECSLNNRNYFSTTTSGSSVLLIDELTNDLAFVNIGELNPAPNLSLSASDMVAFPDASTMANDDTYTVTTSVTADTMEEYNQKILDAIAANSLSTTVTDVPDTPDVPVEDDTTTIIGVLSSIWEGIKSIPGLLSNLGTTIISGIVTGVTSFLDTISGILHSILDAILDFPALLQGIWDTILDFPAYLQNIWEAVLDIPQAIGNVLGNVLEKIKELALSLVVPSEATLTAVQTRFMEKFPIIPDLKSFLDGLTNILQNPHGSAEQLALTSFVNFGNKSGGEYGTAVVNFLDFTWYVDKYKATVDRVIMGVCWCVVLWNLYGQVSAVIAGHAVGTMMSAESTPEGALNAKRRGRSG